jgi:hypothetical protein
MTEVVFKDDNGNWLKTEAFNQEERFNGFSIGYFSRRGKKSGTGFVVKVEEDQESLKSGIILTAAHVFYKNFVYVEESVDFVLGATTYEAKPITRIFSWEDDANFLTDPITEERISVPDDWILCEIWRKSSEITSKIVALNPGKELILSPGDEVFVIGYPREVTPQNLCYVAPGSDSSDLDSVQKSLVYGQELVISSGKILKVGEMVAISCITASGCSGSPVVVNSNGELKYIGLLHGGPASLLHRGISLLIHNALSPSLKKFVVKFYKKLKKFKRQKKHMGFGFNYNVTLLMTELKKLKKIAEKNLPISERDLASTYMRYYELALSIEISLGFKSYYNLCYPVNKILLD